jgi:hypothetical protein
MRANRVTRQMDKPQNDVKALILMDFAACRGWRE